MNNEHAFFLPGCRTGILLIHGLTGTPNEMRGVARNFHQAGYSVYGVQLAGHCGTVQDLVKTQWQDWYASVQHGVAQLKQHVDEVFIVGLSMGALLALAYASQHKVAGVICYSPTFQYDGWSIPTWSKYLGPLLLPPIHYLKLFSNRTFDEAEPYGIKNENLRARIVHAMHHEDSAEAGLPGNPWRSVYQLQRLAKYVKNNLYKITAPTLCLHAYHDDIAARKNSQIIFNHVQGPKKLVWLYNSYHMVTIDNDRKQVIQESLDFIQRYAHSIPSPQQHDVLAENPTE
ncbi:alpha/beta hydrolase [Acinetobacter larvae]|uniref:Alpha/beta hydrolase n=1 Tax=Acinetobacter larvae TaxID=1789224 RepID=A0A1B2LX74_9GAMM|nr:alpha/beta fold hydrolase [Acinetobacter larvae]AOA57537.1 alpha/beta hydrolase [Acinetobacter larvae]